MGVVAGIALAALPRLGEELAELGLEMRLVIGSHLYD